MKTAPLTFLISWLSRLQTLALHLLIFLIPSNLFVKWSESSAYVDGLLVDYLLPKLYLSDIAVGVILIAWGVEKVIVAKNSNRVILPLKKWFGISTKMRLKQTLLTVCLLLLLVRQWFAPHPIAAQWYLVKLIEMGVLSWWLWTHRTRVSLDSVTPTLAATLIFQAGVALYQWWFQQSLAGYLLLGETQLSQAVGIATSSWFGRENIIPYGTAAHPNILGGLAALFTWLLLLGWKIFHRKNEWQKILIFLGIVSGLLLVVLTQSVSAGMSMALGLSVLLLPKAVLNTRHLATTAIVILIGVPLMLTISTHLVDTTTSVTRRTALNQSAVEMFMHQPVWGVGLNNFTATLDGFHSNQELVRFVQPIHHVGLLWLVETGLVGVLLVLLLATSIPKHPSSLLLFICAPILALDHYLLTQQSGLLLVTFFFTNLLRITWISSTSKTRESLTAPETPLDLQPGSEMG